MKWKAIALILVCAALLVGCAGQANHDLSMAEGSTPSGSAFNNDLRLEYITIAKRELDEGDRANSRHFSEKASMAAAGKAVGPDDFSTQHVLPEYESELRSARSRLLTALGGPGAAARPDLAAKAQASFDCWMEESAEPWWQPADRAFCQNNFETAMAGLGDMKVSEKPMAQPQLPRPEEFLVFFDFDSAKLTPEALDILKSAANVATKGNYKRFVLTGHADRSGSTEYNLALSQRRADAVKKELLALGLPGGEIATEAKGESVPLVPTADGVQEPQNRRVEIDMR
jgi:outer membrane protein OmpA-like peptidoglycan-associated protein